MRASWLSLNRSLDSRVFTEDDKTLFNITNILNKANMKKKEYERPTMQVVQLKQQPQLLAGSVQSTRSDYGEAQEYDWE
jgi:hypothetical protein